jgi:hypothetical protein
MNNRLAFILFFLAFLGGGSPAVAQTVSCAMYLTSYNDSARLSFSYGYLEGVEAALTKDIVEVLVSPTHQNHPLRWVTPEGTNSYRGFAEKLSNACKTQRHTDMLQAALSIVQRQDGRPDVGMRIDKEN